MSVALLLMAAAAPAGDDEAIRLREVFIAACVDAQVPADSIEEQPFEGRGKAFERYVEGASARRLFALKGLDNSYLVFGEYQNNSTLEKRCGVFSPKWNPAQVERAVFSSPRLSEGGEFQPPLGRMGYLEAGVKHGRTYKTEIAYGHSRSRGYVMLTVYTPQATAARLEAGKQISACATGKKPENGNCSPGSLRRANQILWSFNGS
jgi:hypothetical protein